MRLRQRESGSAIAWLALALAILAVVVAVVAYYRSGGPPLEREVAREVDEATTVLRRQIAEIEESTREARERMERRALAAQAREALLSARAEIEERGDVEEIRRALAAAGDDLQAMFEGEDESARERWQALRSDLERADDAVGENVDEAFAAVSAALARVDRELERQGAQARTAADEGGLVEEVGEVREESPDVPEPGPEPDT